MRVLGATHIPVANFAQVKVLHHWVSKAERPLERDLPPLLQRQLRRYAPKIAPEPGRGRCA